MDVPADPNMERTAVRMAPTYREIHINDVCEKAIAAQKGMQEVCELLMPKMSLDAISSMTAKWAGNETTLHIAAQKGMQEVCELLMPKMSSGDIKMQDNTNQTALDYAKAKGFESITNAIQSQLLTLAITSGRLDEAKELINQMSEQGLAKTDKEKKTPLHIAVENDYVEIAELLLTKSLKNSVNITDVYNETVLHKATRVNNLKLVELLLAKSSDNQMNQEAIDASTKDGTALHWAARMGNIETIKLLLGAMSQKAINEITRDGTALHVAKRNGYQEITKLISDKMAPTIISNAMDEYGRKASDFDIKNNIELNFLVGEVNSVDDALSEWWGSIIDTDQYYQA